MTPLRILSLGAGVQSSCIALMSARGDLPPLDAAIFADTGDEPAAVYQHLDWLETQLPFPVHRVGGGRSLSQALKDGDDAARIPFHVGAGGLATRQCTRNFKLRPIRQETRRILGVGPRGHVAAGAVEMWVGISVDEVFRIKPSGVDYIVNRHILVEQRMSRWDCLRWMSERQYPRPPKSSCRFCPYQSRAQWIAQRDKAPEDFAKTVALDRWLREPAQVARFHGELFVHSSRVPLAEAQLEKLDDQPDLFNHECEGMCGV